MVPTTLAQKTQPVSVFALPDLPTANAAVTVYRGPVERLRDAIAVAQSAKAEFDDVVGKGSPFHQESWVTRQWLGFVKSWDVGTIVLSVISGGGIGLALNAPGTGFKIGLLAGVALYGGAIALKAQIKHRHATWKVDADKLAGAMDTCRNATGDERQQRRIILEGWHQQFHARQGLTPKLGYDLKMLLQTVPSESGVEALFALAQVTDAVATRYAEVPTAIAACNEADRPALAEELMKRIFDDPKVLDAVPYEQRHTLYEALMALRQPADDATGENVPTALIAPPAA